MLKAYTFLQAGLLIPTWDVAYPQYLCPSKLHMTLTVCILNIVDVKTKHIY